MEGTSKGNTINRVNDKLFGHLSIMTKIFHILITSNLCFFFFIFPNLSFNKNLLNNIRKNCIISYQETNFCNIGHNNFTRFNLFLSRMSNNSFWRNIKHHDMVWIGRRNIERHTIIESTRIVITITSFSCKLFKWMRPCFKLFHVFREKLCC